MAGPEGTRRLSEQQLSHPRATSRLQTGGPWWERRAGSRMSLPSPPPLQSETSNQQVALKTKGTGFKKPVEALTSRRAWGRFLNISKTDNVVIQSLFSHVQFSCDLMDCSPPGPSPQGMLQARILEWVAMPSSRGSFAPSDWTWVSCIAGWFFGHWATREAQHWQQMQRSLWCGRLPWAL